MGDEENKGVLTSSIIQDCKSNFLSDKKNILALNACSKCDPTKLCLQRSVLNSVNHVFTHKVEQETKPVTNQKYSELCWIFAALNTLRIPFSKYHQLEEFEFSQPYLSFWDLFEKCNFFLNTVMEELLEDESIDGRLMTHLLSNPITDAGQYSMVVNIIKKYGLIPKSLYKPTYNDGYTVEPYDKVVNILKTKLRYYTHDLNQSIKSGIKDKNTLQDQIKTYMKEVYTIIAICYSIPPEIFTWEYYDAQKEYKCIGPITPKEFYEKHVKPHCNIETKVCLVNDPRPENPFNNTYTVRCLGNVLEGERIIYLNVEIDDMLKYIAQSIQNSETVWFGCDHNYGSNWGLYDTKLLDYNLIFNTDLSLGLPKSERLHYRDTEMTHAMVFTAVSLNEKDEITKLRVENSWGEECGEKGFICMTADWFKEYGFEIAIDRKYISEEHLEALEQKPKVLPPWDPLGVLAF